MKPWRYSTRKHMWHCFWKDKRSSWESKQNECLCKSSRPKGSLKKVLWKFSQNSQENMGIGISFKIKLNSLDLQFYQKWIFKRRFFLLNFEKFAEHHQTTASDYSSINSSGGRIGKRNCKLWYKNQSICTNLSRKCKLLKRTV